jgi:hypothetical protein
VVLKCQILRRQLFLFLNSTHRTIASKMANIWIIFATLKASIEVWTVIGAIESVEVSTANTNMKF